MKYKCSPYIDLWQRANILQNVPFIVSYFVSSRCNRHRQWHCRPCKRHTNTIESHTRYLLHLILPDLDESLTNSPVNIRLNFNRVIVLQ